MSETKKPRSAAGSYRARGKDTYEVRYKGESTTVKAKNDQEAARELAKFITRVDEGKYKRPAKMTLQDLSIRFLRDNPDLSEPTRENYKIHLDKRILLALGHKKIDKITPANIYDFLNNLKEDGIRADGKPGGLSPATIQKNFHILSSMLAFAVEMGEIKENPCDRVKPPKIPKRKKASIDKDPAREMLRALANESLKWRCITLLGASTGERRGEVLGIGDKTLDLVNCVIYVDRASRHMKGARVVFDNPKTETSKRAIPFHPSLVPLLQAQIDYRNKQRDKCGDKWHNQIEVNGEMVYNDLLFTQWNGKPMHPNSVDTWFSKFREDNNLPENLTFHGLRHTNITQLLKHGVDVGTAADNAGHAKKSTTLDYDDPDIEALRQVPEKANEAFDLENIVPDLINLPINIYRKREKKAQ
ncbi:MAG: site-specific integrase [Syntrophomonadaceae bacterium]|nr:site-specific integrase [Syntrophomonadaceae bacterium]